MNGIGLIFHKNQTKSPISKQIKNFSNKIEERGQNTTILKNYENLDLFLSSQKNEFIFEQDEYYVIADSRIDNKKTIIEALGDKKNIYNDEELIFNVYKELGIDGFSILEGPFSFIIVNTITKEVIVARDFFGQRPLHYYEDENILIICSELDPIFDLGIQKELNKSKLVNFIFSLFSKNNETFFKDIYKLNGGQLIAFKKDDKSTIEFNKVPGESKHLFNLKDTITKFNEIYTQVINDQISNTNGPICTSLSGGLDSSSIATLISRHKVAEKKSSFSIHFKGLNEKEFKIADESNFIAEVLKKTGLAHEHISLSYETSSTLNEMKNNNIFHVPYSMVNGYIHRHMYERCVKNDSSVFFDGLFGDEIISHGTFKLQELLIKKRFIKFLVELYFLKKRGLVFSIRHQIKINILKPMMKSLKKFFFNSSLQLEYDDNSDLVNRRLLPELVDLKKSNIHNFVSEYDEQLRFLKSGVIENTLEQIDFITSRMNIDCRFPFLDKRILDFTINIPTDMKMKNGVTRYYYREALKDILPAKVYERNSKGNLSFFGKRDIKENYRSIIDEMGRSKTNIYKLIDLEKLKKKMDSNSKDSLYVIFFNIYSLDVWMKNNNFNL